MNKRLIWADSLKGILIILVILGHSIQEVLKQGCFDNHLWNLIYSFHMPAFMAISGFVCYRMGSCNSSRLFIIKRRFQQLMIPFFLWALIRVAVNPPYCTEAFINVFLYPDGSFWFLWVLFFITVLFQLGDWLSELMRIKQEWLIGAICIILASLMVLVNIRVLGFQFIAYYFLFYSYGYYLRKYNQLVTQKTFPLFVLFVVWAMLAWNWNMHELPSFMLTIHLPQSLLQYSYRFITALVAIYVLLGLFPKLFDARSKREMPIERLGVISLGIYTTHILLMPFIVNALKLFTQNQNILILAAFILALVISWVLIWLLSKWKVSARLLLGKI